MIRSLTASSEKTSTTTRRRSWFLSGTGTELNGEQAKEVEEEVREGKEPSAKPDNILTPPHDIPAVQPLDASDNDQDAHERLPPRPSSAHSHTRSRSLRTHSVSSSVGGDETSNYLSDVSATSNKSQRQSFTTSTTSSFLSTLKSKAGDKHALSNTAKEAMRKWGVNWGLKKENGGNPSPDELPDLDPSDHRPRTESTQGRQSYADMRAAVIERREREQPDRVNGSTSPIPIPQRGGGEKGRSTSASGGRMTPHSGGSTSPALSRSLGDVSSDPFKDRDFSEVEEEKAAPSLIHTQPSQARTMTIPGIHASHRGEVMSMGNVAPALPATESKPKGPTIQSVYRLWKSPILTGQQSQEASSSTSPRHEDTNDGNHDVAPLALTPEVTSPPSRAVPPPLPPRTIPSVAVRYATEDADEPPVSPSVSAASEALRSIASRDETRRVSVEANVPADVESTSPLETPEVSGIPASRPDSKPPLPPRRIAV